MKLKYGMNPHQGFAEIELNENLKVLNGTPSFINFLDALNAWQLVFELETATNKVAAASFKHVSPSGASMASSFLANEKESYNHSKIIETEQTVSYLKARGSDRLASFGDFIALSSVVESELARLIKTEVSDGIIAPGYSDDALEILKEKKKGNYCILEINKEYKPRKIEQRDLFGFSLRQDRNDLMIERDHLKKIRTSQGNELNQNVLESLLAGLITLKYTQSNSINVIYNGHVIGVGAGQQSRILCSELALTKANKWYQKTKLNYNEIDYPTHRKLTKTIKDQIHDSLRDKLFNSKPLLNELDGLCLCSDAYFPQIDNIELANKFGIKFIAAPMGSIQDAEVIKKCNEFGITFVEIDFRLFHH